MNKRPNAIKPISLTENSFWTHIPECGGFTLFTRTTN